MTATAEPGFRPFAPADLERLQGIRARAFAPVFRSFRDIVGARMAEPLFGDADARQRDHLDELARTEAGGIIVAELGGRPVVFIHVKSDPRTGVGEIGLNAVDPAFHNRGIGTSMYRMALDRFRAEGLKVAAVSTGGDPSQEPARRAYAKAGFAHPLPAVSYYREL